MRLFFLCFLLLLKIEVKAQTDVLKDSRDGHEYKTVQIGTQTWMAENLLYTAIPCSYCFDSLSPVCINKPCNDMYGAYYTWDAAQKACPAEWHLPGKEEFEKLLVTIGGTKKDKFNALIKGGSSGFNVLLGSGWGRVINKDSAGVVFFKCAGFWTSTENDEKTTYRFFFSTLKTLNFVAENKQKIAFSVRCIKD